MKTLAALLVLTLAAALATSAWARLSLLWEAICRDRSCNAADLFAPLPITVPVWSATVWTELDAAMKRDDDTFSVVADFRGDFE